MLTEADHLALAEAGKALLKKSAAIKAADSELSDYIHPSVQKALAGAGLGAAIGGVAAHNGDLDPRLGAMVGAFAGGALPVGYDLLAGNLKSRHETDNWSPIDDATGAVSSAALHHPMATAGAGLGAGYYLWGSPNPANARHILRKRLDVAAGRTVPTALKSGDPANWKLELHHRLAPLETAHGAISDAVEKERLGTILGDLKAHSGDAGSLTANLNLNRGQLQQLFPNSHAAISAAFDHADKGVSLTESDVLNAALTDQHGALPEAEGLAKKVKSIPFFGQDLSRRLREDQFLHQRGYATGGRSGLLAIPAGLAAGVLADKALLG